MATAVFIPGDDVAVFIAIQAAAIESGYGSRLLQAGEHLQAYDILCPLTLKLPPDLRFWGSKVFAACQNLDTLRQVVTEMGYETGNLQFWLPIVHTAKGPLYAEAITHPHYQQPLDLDDQQRQPLYQLGYRLLTYLEAPPAVYLLGCGYQSGKLVFDRLIPFPTTAALASIKVQQPNLFVCHWRCLTGQPILDLLIPSNVKFQSLATTQHLPSQLSRT
jgi:hypothetical protein